MPIINIQNNESFDLVLRKFKKLCDKTGIFNDIKKHEFYIKPSIKRKMKKKIYFNYNKLNLLNDNINI